MFRNVICIFWSTCCSKLTQKWFLDNSELFYVMYSRTGSESNQKQPTLNQIWSDEPRIDICKWSVNWELLMNHMKQSEFVLMHLSYRSELLVNHNKANPTRSAVNAILHSIFTIILLSLLVIHMWVGIDV